MPILLQRLLLAICLFAGNGLALAAPMTSMYQGIVPVADQGLEARQAGLSAAMEQVIVRLSGQQYAAQSPGIAHALRQADSYMLRYGYETRRDNGSAQIFLKAQFDEELTKALMRHAELPMWIVGRPTVMLWLALERERDDGELERVIVNPETAPDIARELVREFERRGLPYVWPSLDIADYQALAADDVWALDADKLLLATERYGHPVVFAGRAQQDALSGWDGHWIVLGQNEQRLLEKGESATLSSFAAPAVDDLADSLASEYGVQVQGGQESEVALEVEGITGFLDYRQVMQQFQAMGVVRSVTVVGTEAGALKLRLLLEGSAEQFVDAMQLQQQLLAVDTQADTLVYRLRDASLAGEG